MFGMVGVMWLLKRGVWEREPWLNGAEDTESCRESDRSDRPRVERGGGLWNDEDAAGQAPGGFGTSLHAVSSKSVGGSNA